MIVKVWLADLLGSLRHTGQCFICGRQFLSRNVYVWRDTIKGTKYCSPKCAGISTH